MAETITYEITHYIRSGGFSTRQRLDNDLIGIPLFTDTGTGIFNSSVMVIDTPDGKYITSGTIIDDRDRIRIKVTNTITSNVYNRLYDVVKRTIKLDTVKGGYMELTLLGLEHWIDKFNYSQKGFFKSAFDMGEKMIKQYSDSKGDDTPSLTSSVNSTSTNKLPNFTNNIYDYGIGPDKIYQRLLDLADRQGGSVENGGVLDYYDIRVDTDDTDAKLMNINIFSSGDPDNTEGNEVTIKDTLNDPVGEIRGAIDTEEANIINNFGGDTSGSLPREYTVFKSGEERWNFTPEWNSGSIFYPKDARVTLLGVHYKCLVNHTSSALNRPPNVINWQVVTEAQEYGNVNKYSPYTKDKAISIWKNGNANPGGTKGTFSQDAQIDGNVVIWDEDFFRIPVDVRAINPVNIPNEFKYHENVNGYYRGLTVLVDTVLGPVSGDFIGSDENGRVFANSIVTYDNENKRWLVKYEKTNGLYAAVHDEADVYRYNGATSAWVNETDQNLLSSGKADCYHGPARVGQTEGIIEGFTENNNSAVFAEYEYEPLRANGANRNKAEYYKQGAWLTMRFPLPTTSYNGISEDVGDIFGGGTLTTTPGSADDLKEPAALDIQNNEWIPNGKRGWNNGIDTENLGQISSIEFFMKIKDQFNLIDGGPYQTVPLAANYKVRGVAIDLNDNVAIQDFNLDFVDKWQPIELPVSGFSVIRNRRPKEITDIVIPPKELNVVNNFEWRHVKQITFQTQESYDDQGRYDPIIGRYGPSSLFLLFSRRVTMVIDGFRFTKPLLANTGKVTTLPIEHEILESPDIHNYYQLLGNALSEKEKIGHKFVEYTIITNADFDIKHGEFFFYENTKLVPFSDNNSKAGTVKLVARHIEYSMTEDGLIRTLVGIRRFE